MKVQSISPVKSISHQIRSRSLTLSIHTNESAFLTLDKEWAKLAQLSNQMICMSPGWASSWWKHLGRHKNRSLYIVTIYDKHKLVAIFPLFKGITKMGGITIQERLQIIGSGGSTNEQLGFTDDYGVSDFLDFIVDPEYSLPVRNLFFKLLDSPEFVNYQITFHQARDDSYIMKFIYPLLKNSKRKVRAECTDTCYYIELDQVEDFQDFIKKSKSNARRRFRQTLRACGIGNEYIIEEPAAMADVDKMINKLMQLHQEKWNSMGYPGTFEDERFREFFKEISFAAYEDKRLWIKQAVDESGVCAVRMLLMYNGRYYDYMSGYDNGSPSAKHRPGIGLLLNLVENSFKLNIERIELLRGDESYKYDFSHLYLNNWKITIHEVSHREMGWGLPAAFIQAASILLKYLNREKMLLKVQHDKVGGVYMLSEYFKFRFNTLKNKLKQPAGPG
jgi:hypothetical protein